MSQVGFKPTPSCEDQNTLPRPEEKDHLEYGHPDLFYKYEFLIINLCKKFGIQKGETTKDKKFTVTGVQCLGACGYAPMMQINEKYYENLTLEEVDKIINSME